MVIIQIDRITLSEENKRKSTKENLVFKIEVYVLEMHLGSNTTGILSGCLGARKIRFLLSS